MKLEIWWTLFALIVVIGVTICCVLVGATIYFCVRQKRRRRRRRRAEDNLQTVSQERIVRIEQWLSENECRGL